MEGKDLAYCSGCDHLSRKTCDYLIHVGHSRGCPPGVGCPLHTRPEKAKTAVETGKLAKKKPDTTPLDELRAMQLYNDGLDDIAMADALGVTAKRVQNWRLRMHLKRPNAGQKKKIEKEKKSSMSQENEQAAKEVSFHQVVKQPETVETASCRQVSELPETQRISAEAVETPGAAASENTQEEREPMTAETMLQICERIVGAGLGHLPLRIDGRDVRDFLVIALVKTPDGAIIEMTN